MNSFREQTFLILIGIIVGILFGLGYDEWGKNLSTTNNLTDWITAISSLLLFVTALYTALSWRSQRIPEARKDFINNIVEFDNYIYRFGNKEFDMSSVDSFIQYHE